MLVAQVLYANAMFLCGSACNHYSNANAGIERHIVYDVVLMHRDNRVDIMECVLVCKMNRFS